MRFLRRLLPQKRNEYHQAYYLIDVTKPAQKSFMAGASG